MSRLVRKIFTGKRIAGAHLQKICAKAYFNENGPGNILVWAQSVALCVSAVRLFIIY